MNWKEKLQIIREAARAIPEMAIVFGDAAGADQEFVDGLRREFPYLDHDYLELLRFSDGLHFDMFVLFGSGESKFESILAARRRLAPVFDDEALPISAHPCTTSCCKKTGPLGWSIIE